MTEITRTPDGRFIKGKSANPAGRPVGKKNRITAMKQDLELAIRENLQPGHVQAIVAAMVAEALDGNVGAAKLILDKVMSNARVDDDVNENGNTFTIKIENLTATLAEPEDNDDVIDGEVIDTEEVIQ